MSYFIYQDKQIYYQEVGEGKPLLFLHGNTASSQMFGSIVGQYAKNNKVILLDFLGNGKSDRLQQFPVDFWYEEAQQIIAFLQQKKYEDLCIIGSSGGALAAINVALERPDLVSRVIADSFEGDRALLELAEHIVRNRELSKQNPGARMFYQAMQGADWEDVIDSDTKALAQHAKEIGAFFHQPLSCLQADILMTGSREDELLTASDKTFYEKTYSRMLEQIGHGKMYLFEHGGHPAMLSNQDEFVKISLAFLREE